MMHRVVRVGLIIVCAFFITEVRCQNQRKADSLLVLIDNHDLSSFEEMEAYYWLSAYSSSPEDELKYGRELLKLAERRDEKEFIIKANLRIGVAHRLMGNLGQALDFLFKSAKDAANGNEYEPLLTDIYAEISTCYTQNGDSENALHYGLKTIEILRRYDRKKELSLNLLNLGYDLFIIGHYDSAMAYYNEAEPIIRENGMTIGLAYLIGNRALVHWKKGDLDKAKEGLNQAIGMLEPLGDPYGISDYYNQLGNIYLEENKPEAAIDFLLKSLDMAKQEGLKEQARDASFLLVDAYRKTDQPYKALDFQTEYFAYKDSIQNLETTQQVANLRTRFEVGQKQTEVDLLLEQKRSNQIIMITGGIILLIVICLALVIYIYFKSTRTLNHQLKEQKKDLINLNNTKDKFFSIISHDLRGPVNILNGFIYVIKYRRDEQSPEELQRILDHMENSAGGLVKLLDNLLYWALQQKGDFPYSPKSHSLKSILSDVVELFDTVTESKRIELNLYMQEDFNVLVDRNSTSTIFRNLLSNASKFTHEGGLISVSAKKLNDKVAEIEVKDNGTGIPKKKLANLFKLSEKISTVGTSGESGVGLGLQLVYEFVQLNNGEIHVQSKEGKGTTFTINLPLESDQHYADGSLAFGSEANIITE